MAEVTRPTWENRELGEYQGSSMPQFRIDGNFIIPLNPVIKEGTHHNSGNMNNLMVFDNLIAFAGTNYTKTTEKSADGEIITEKIYDIHNSEDLIAERVTNVTELNEDTKYNVTEKLYLDGIMVQERRQLITAHDFEITDAEVYAQ